MKTITLDFEVSWADSNMSKEEHHPQVRIYFDNRILRDPIIVEHAKRPISAQIKGEINTKLKLPHDLRVGVAAFAWRKNDYDAPCLMDIGTNHLLVSKIQDAVAGSPTGEYSEKIPVIMHTVNNYVKGHLLFSFRKNAIKLSPGLEFSLPSITSQLNISEYIENTLRVEQRMRDTIPGTTRIRVPYYMGEYGLELAEKSPLPALAFVVTEIPKINTRFCVNALQNVMVRDGLVLADWDRLNTEGKARAAVLSVCNMIQAFDYVSDTIDKNTPDQAYDPKKIESIENFGNGLVTGSLDCEDGGSGILSTHNAFITHQAKKPVPQLVEAQQILHQYIPMLSLDAVKGASVGDDEDRVGAHMNDNYIPVATFMKWLRKTREGRQIAKKLPFDKIEYDETLPFMVAEGTGMYEPLGYNNPYANAANYVYQAPSLSPYRKPISHDKNVSTNFFIGSLTGLTDYFIRRGCNVGTFTYATVQPDGTLTRGAYYHDMITAPEKIALIAADPVPKEMMKAINTAVSIRVPPEPLVLTKEGSKNKRNEHLDYICENITKKSSTANTLSIPVFVRPYQINRKLARAVVDDFKKLPRIVGADYVEEHYTDKQYGYCLNVKVEIK